MNNGSKNQNQLIPVFSEYFSDDNSKCQIWAAYSTKNDKITAYVFLTSNPLTSYVSEDCIAIRLLSCHILSCSGVLIFWGRGYQAARKKRPGAPFFKINCRSKLYPVHIKTFNYGERMGRKFLPKVF